MQKEECRELLHLLLNMGENMLNSGAEIFRVEQTIYRMASYYGAKRTSVFAISSSIVITVDFGNTGLFTETRRISGMSASTNFSKMEKYNALSRECEKKPLPLDELKEKIESISHEVNVKNVYIGSAVAAGAFTVFFGGGLKEGVVAAVVALFICFMQIKFTPLCPNNTIFNFFASLASGTVVCLFSMMFKSFSYESIIMGDIMLLIPGVAITNSLRDVFVGDTVSGSMRFIESLVWTVGLAAGYMIPIYFAGVIA